MGMGSNYYVCTVVNQFMRNVDLVFVWRAAVLVSIMQISYDYARTVVTCLLNLLLCIFLIIS